MVCMHIRQALESMGSVWGASDYRTIVGFYICIYEAWSNMNLQIYGGMAGRSGFEYMNVVKIAETTTWVKQGRPHLKAVEWIVACELR